MSDLKKVTLEDLHDLYTDLTARTGILMWLAGELADLSRWLLAEQTFRADWYLGCLEQMEQENAYREDCHRWETAEARWRADDWRWGNQDPDPFPWWTPST